MEPEHRDFKAEENISADIRQNLVDTAVGFLNMNKIVSQPEDIKRQFLSKKGLTNKEIDMAFSLAKSMIPVPPKASNDELYGAQLIPSANNIVYMPPPSNFWTKLRDVTNTIVFLSGIFIGVKYLYKHYVGPFLTGKKPKSREDSVLQVQKSVMEVLQQIEVTLGKINRNILDQNEATIKAALAPQSSTSIEDLKTELQTIKSLLVNKKSFPAPPLPSLSIPEWQKISKSPPAPQSSPPADDEGDQRTEKSEPPKQEKVIVNGNDPADTESMSEC